MAKTLELPEGKYKVSKIEMLDAEAFTMVPLQYSVTGEYAPRITVGERYIAQGRGFSDTVSTSPVEDFELLPNAEVRIKTANSYYLIKEIID